MSITVYQWGKLADNRTAEQQQDKRQRFTVTYQVIVNDIKCSAKDVRDFSSLPAYGSAHPEESRAVVVNRRAEQDSKNERRWLVHVEYDSSGDPVNNEGVPQEVAWNSRFRQKIAEVDNAGQDIRNSAGDPFDPPPEYEVVLPELTVTRWETDSPVKKIADFNGKLNSNSFTISSGATEITCAAGTVKVTIRGERSRLPVGYRWKVTYVFEIDFEGWEQPILDQGFRYLNGGALDAIRIGKPPATPAHPVPLNGSGGILAHGSDLVYIDFSVRGTADFSTLGMNWEDY